MQCQYCASELSPDSVVCENCGAKRVTQRTPAGVIAGWVGMTMAVVWSLVWLPLLILPFTERGISGYPWPALIIGTLITAGLLWYSKSTVHTTWVRKDN